MLRKTARIFGRLLLGFLIVIIAGYLFLLIINWQDAHPNASSKQMQTLLQYDSVAPEHNGYLFFVANSNSIFTLSGPLFSLSQQCQVAERCQSALNQQEDLAELLATKQTLQQFYWQLLQHTEWQQPAPVMEQLPPYQPLRHGQQLLLWQAWLYAKQANVEQVALMIEADFRFWLTVLENSNFLLTKMVSAHALQQHFELVPIIINQLPEAQRMAAIPYAWTQVFSNDALNLERVLAGEWHYGATIMQNIWFNSAGNPNEYTVFERISIKLLKPLFLLQDTKNTHADQLMQHESTLSFPWYSWLRNPVGKSLLVETTPNYATYQQRLQQLEPARQAALQQVSSL